MTLEELRGNLFDVVTDPPCRECEFWDYQGHYCFLSEKHPDNKKCQLVDKISELFKEALPELAKEAGYVKLANTSPEDTIEDGFGSVWSAWCPQCGEKSMSIVRPGKVQCSNCG